MPAHAEECGWAAESKQAGTSSTDGRDGAAPASTVVVNPLPYLRAFGRRSRSSDEGGEGDRDSALPPDSSRRAREASMPHRTLLAWREMYQRAYRQRTRVSSTP